VTARRHPRRLRNFFGKTAFPHSYTGATLSFRQCALPTRSLPMSLGTIVLIILILALLGVIPSWPYSTGWGYGPSGIVGVILVIVLILVLLGRL
jgi:hypothetical protein